MRKGSWPLAQSWEFRSENPRCFLFKWACLQADLTPCRVSMQSSELNYTVKLACILWEMPLCKQRPNSGPKVFSLLPMVSMCVSVIIFQCPGDKVLLFKQTARLFLVHICVSYRTTTFPRYHQITILISNLDFHPATDYQALPSISAYQSTCSVSIEQPSLYCDGTSL